MSQIAKYVELGTRKTSGGNNSGSFISTALTDKPIKIDKKPPSSLIIRTQISLKDKIPKDKKEGSVEPIKKEAV